MQIPLIQVFQHQPQVCPLTAKLVGKLIIFIPSQESQMDENQPQFHDPGVQPVASGARENAQQSDPSRPPPVSQYE